LVELGVDIATAAKVFLVGERLERYDDETDRLSGVKATVVAVPLDDGVFNIGFEENGEAGGVEFLMACKVCCNDETPPLGASSRSFEGVVNRRLESSTFTPTKTT
jgi:hypothetical protein